MNASIHQSSQEDGFNYDLGKTWIYPTNLPVRKYQKDIVSEALFKNTMVCLPTGLGKTFIAAVVMHNYYRWFPHGKVIFMATTKPLVKQQIDACYRIVAMPKETTAELTGAVLKQNRQHIWKSKRVFFLTPQVLLNDLDTVPNLGAEIKCIVLDEAHRARGNHAYCEVIQKLISIHSNFRILALTATPASSVIEVVNVCKNLFIAHLEIRTEDSPDVVPYLHHKSMETVVIKLDGKLKEVMNLYKTVLDKYVRILIKHNVIHSNYSSLHKGRLFYLSKEYQEKNTHNRQTAEYKLITKVFGTCTILYHAHDLLIRHGLRSFLKFYQENISKPLLIGCCTEIKELMATISDYVGPPLVCDKLPDGSHLKLPDNCKFGHPKFYKMSQILTDHFKSHDANSKVIIFCEYKESVVEAYAMLLQQKEIKPKMFMGQSSITQKQQVNIIESFRSGGFNTLISTCIGEEGIDVGFVDLVICFDISNKSSVRLIQRIGRTGRDRNGRVVILVSEGREQQVLKDCLHEKQHLCDTLVHAKSIDGQLYKDNPRMIPADVEPQCQELFIDVKVAKPIEHHSDSTAISNFIPSSSFLCFNQMMANNLQDEEERSGFTFTKQLYRQRFLHSQHDSTISTSQDCDIFNNLMKLIEYKRYNIPFTTETQNATIRKPKQADIRNLFKQTTLTQKIANYTNNTNKTDDDDELGLKRTIETKISSVLTNIDECQLCNAFENNMVIKRDVVTLVDNSLVDLSAINYENVTNLLEKYKNKELDNNNVSCDSVTTVNADVTVSEEKEEVKAVPMKLDNQDENPYNLSDDLFDDCDFPEMAVHETSEISEKIETPPRDLLKLDEADDAIETSPLVNVSMKRKMSSYSSASDNSEYANPENMIMHRKKRLKVDDIFDFTSVTGVTGTKPLKTNQDGVDKLNKTTLTPIEKESDIFDEMIFEDSFPQVSKSTAKTKTKPKISVFDILDSAFSPATATSVVKSTEAKSTVGKKSTIFDILDNSLLPTYLKNKSTCNASTDQLDNIKSKPNEDATLKSPVMNKFSITATKNRLAKRKISTSDICSLTFASTDNKLNKSVVCKDGADTAVINVDSDASPDSPVLNRMKKPRKRFNNLDVTDVFGETTLVKPFELPQQTSKQFLATRSSNKLPKPKAKCTRSVRQFIDSEAEVSSDEIQSSDEPAAGSDDVFEASFVDDDDNADIANHTHMQAIYLQSVRSPIKRTKPLFRPVQRTDSFIDDPFDQTYAKDSFCVDTDSLESEAHSQESLSELERAELELANKKKTKHRKSKTDSTVTSRNKCGKWNRISLDISDSD